MSRFQTQSDQTFVWNPKLCSGIKHFFGVSTTYVLLGNPNNYLVFEIHTSMDFGQSLFTSRQAKLSRCPRQCKQSQPGLVTSPSQLHCLKARFALLRSILRFSTLVVMILKLSCSYSKAPPILDSHCTFFFFFSSSAIFSKILAISRASSTTL